RVADGASQLNLGQIVSVKAGNVVFIRGGNALLRLNHFEIVGYTCGKTISPLEQRLIRQIDRTFCKLQLLVGSGKVVQRSTKSELDSATQILKLLSILP